MKKMCLKSGLNLEFVILPSLLGEVSFWPGPNFFRDQLQMLVVYMAFCWNVGNIPFYKIRSRLQVTENKKCPKWIYGTIYCTDAENITFTMRKIMVFW